MCAAGPGVVVRAGSGGQSCRDAPSRRDPFSRRKPWRDRASSFRGGGPGQSHQNAGLLPSGASQNPVILRNEEPLTICGWKRRGASARQAPRRLRPRKVRDPSQAQDDRLFTMRRCRGNPELFDAIALGGGLLAVFRRRAGVGNKDRRGPADGNPRAVQLRGDDRRGHGREHCARRCRHFGRCVWRGRRRSERDHGRESHGCLADHRDRSRHLEAGTRDAMRRHPWSRRASLTAQIRSSRPRFGAVSCRWRKTRR